MTSPGCMGAEDAAKLKQDLLAIGFDRVGFAPAGEPADFPRYSSWIDAGHGGTMSYLSRHRDLRRDPSALLPGARSVILFSLGYHGGEKCRSVSSYARGRDYHRVIKKRLRLAERLLVDDYGAGLTRSVVDSAPLLERSLAAASGLGWIGKNTMLIDERLGSYTFLGAVLCDLDLPADDKAAGRCGSCTACIDACPTDAFTTDGQLDARRCISYLTIEHEGEIDGDLPARMGEWIFGCDICQEVCPWNRRAPITQVEDFAPRGATAIDDPREILALDDDAFLARFAGTSIMRAGLSRMKRSAAIALANRRRGK